MIHSRHNIVELIETEKEYVKDLALIVEVGRRDLCAEVIFSDILMLIIGLHECD